MNPVAALADAVKRSFSMTDITRQDIDSKPKIPAIMVIKRLAAKLMTFIKVLDTIDSISDYLSVVKLDDVRSFVSMIVGVFIKAEFQSSLFIRGNCWSCDSQ